MGKVLAMSALREGKFALILDKMNFVKDFPAQFSKWQAGSRKQIK
jgi:hypothetical protein